MQSRERSEQKILYLSMGRIFYSAIDGPPLDMPSEVVCIWWYLRLNLSLALHMQQWGPRRDERWIFLKYEIAQKAKGSLTVQGSDQQTAYISPLYWQWWYASLSFSGAKTIRSDVLYEHKRGEIHFCTEDTISVLARESQNDWGKEAPPEII